MKTIHRLFLTFICVSIAGLQLHAVSPAPDGCYSNFTTAEGCDALNLLATGEGNTGVGWRSLFSDGSGSFNTSVGAGALVLNNADSNTAVGAAALLLNTSGTENTAVGTGTLVSNDTGDSNSAVGTFALQNNTTGASNTAVGFDALQRNIGGGSNTGIGDVALFSNTSADNNTAIGFAALFGNTTGTANTATGVDALQSNTTGDNNTAIGFEALLNTTGTNNIALGFKAGFNLTGDDNIDIGNEGVSGESNTIRIGDTTQQGATYIAGINGVPVAGVPVLIDSSNRLGNTSSSRRFKDDIKPMDKGSEALFALKPVSFRYKKEIDPAGTSQFGLVAEDVAKLNPDLIVRDKEGKPYGVRYDQINAMLLNEFLKEHNKVEKQDCKLQEQGSMIARQQKQIEALTAGLQKVSAQLEANRPAPQVVNNP
jgi:hypothetical protein